MMADECKYDNKVPMVCDAGNITGFVSRLEFARRISLSWDLRLTEGKHELDRSQVLI